MTITYYTKDIIRELLKTLKSQFSYIYIYSFYKPFKKLYWLPNLIFTNPLKYLLSSQFFFLHLPLRRIYNLYKNKIKMKKGLKIGLVDD